MPLVMPSQATYSCSLVFSAVASLALASLTEFYPPNLWSERFEARVKSPTLALASASFASSSTLLASLTSFLAFSSSESARSESGKHHKAVRLTRTSFGLDIAGMLGRWRDFILQFRRSQAEESVSLLHLGSLLLLLQLVCAAGLGCGGRGGRLFIRGSGGLVHLGLERIEP